ncbi:MAG: hypothetical protein JTT11_06260, partial [Candidatus Brockarchaeota archaeon]|nr:hypothetical protein [Candidatus Brockarchaeota archaeon]
GRPIRYYAELERSGRGYEVVEPSEGENDICDVFVSHVHSDHSKLCTVLGSSSTIHMGRLASCLFLNNASLSSRLDLFSKLFFRDGKSAKARNTYRCFEDRVKIGVGGLEILPLAVDHSTPSSFGFIATCRAGSLAYTGDLRFHGPASKLSFNFAETAREHEVDVLITEGTNVGEGRPQKEADVERFATELIERSNKAGNPLTLVKVSPADIDRVSSMAAIAKRLGNEVVLTKGVALTVCAASSLGERLRFSKLPDLKECKILVSGDDFPPDRRSRFLEDAGLGGSFVTISQLRSERARRPRAVISRGDLNLFKLKPPPRSLYIFSTSEPVNEEEEFNLEREVNTAQLLGLLFYHVHASGHASPLDLVEMVKTIRPKRLIPIHTENPDAFEKAFSDHSEVVLPQKGKPIAI